MDGNCVLDFFNCITHLFNEPETALMVLVVHGHLCSSVSVCMLK